MQLSSSGRGLSCRSRTLSFFDLGTSRGRIVERGALHSSPTYWPYLSTCHHLREHL